MCNVKNPGMAASISLRPPVTPSAVSRSRIYFMIFASVFDGDRVSVKQYINLAFPSKEEHWIFFNALALILVLNVPFCFSRSVIFSISTSRLSQTFTTDLSLTKPLWILNISTTGKKHPCWRVAITNSSIISDLNWGFDRFRIRRAKYAVSYIVLLILQNHCRACSRFNPKVGPRSLDNYEDFLLWKKLRPANF